jgi:adenylate kinase family enzyme
MLTDRDELVRRPERVLVAGTSGSGKTTLAAQAASVLGIPHVEIDSLYHGPRWVPRENFVADVERLTARPAWVTEWQYHAVRSLLLERADLLVWLDLGRWTVMRQVSARTLRRRLGHHELWNGNVEPPLRTFVTDPEHVVRWAWSTHHLTAERVAEGRRRRPELVVVRLTGRRSARSWLEGPLRRAAGG